MTVTASLRADSALSDPAERRARYWVWGLLGWIAITLLCILLHLGSLEDHLASEATGALAAQGVAITDQQVSFNGEIATLAGTVIDQSTKDRAGEAVAAVRGVRRVNNDLVVEAAAEPAPEPAPQPAPVLRAGSLSATVEGARVVLTGEVPNRIVADRWVAAAEAEYGAGNVEDRLVVSDEIEEETWWEATAVVASLGGIEDGSVDIAEGTITLTGVVASQTAKTTIGDAVAAAAPELTVDNQLLVVAEEPPPATEAIEDLDLSGVTFETGSASLTDASLPILDEAVAVLAANPEITIEIQGHTDADGSAAANQSLSQARAEAVADYLIAQGIGADRLTAVGYGEDQPVATNDTPDGKAMNRRIEFKITGGR